MGSLYATLYYGTTLSFIDLTKTDDKKGLIKVRNRLTMPYPSSKKYLKGVRETSQRVELHHGYKTMV